MLVVRAEVEPAGQEWTSPDSRSASEVGLMKTKELRPPLEREGRVEHGALRHKAWAEAGVGLLIPLSVLSEDFVSLALNS